MQVIRTYWRFRTMQANLTPYTDINRLLALLLTRMQAVLGQKLVGLYIFGSLVAGDFDPGSSDIDLIAATSTYLDEDEIERLKVMHDDIAHQEKVWDDRIEVGYIPLDELRRYNPRFQQPLISPGEPFHLTTVEASWIINRYIMREKGIAVYGPPPKTLVDPISREERIQAVRGRIQDWKEYVESPEFSAERKSQAYAIQTMCRILYSLRYGEFASKKEAALWAEKNLPPEWSWLIRSSLAWRDNWRDEQVDHE